MLQNGAACEIHSKSIDAPFTERTTMLDVKKSCATPFVEQLLS